ncbi:hypothetical protein [Kitasatospora sp. NPDC015120]|uniref:hypothetical protein n=1 Tax=Kitasatospora sp. NPDC015120 TaxID=3364023 RepID=UPI0036F48C10
MTTLDFADLATEAERKHTGKGLKFIAKNGRKVRLRRIEAMPGGDLKSALALLHLVQSKKVSNERLIEAMTGLLIAVASDKKAMRGP